MTNKKYKSKFESFEAIYTSGLIINPSLLTSLCIIFDRIHILNNIEYVISFAKTYTLSSPISKIRKTLIKETQIIIKDKQNKMDLLAELNDEEKFIAKIYIFNALKFADENLPLLRNIIDNRLYQRKTPVKLIQKTDLSTSPEYVDFSIPGSRFLINGLNELNAMVENGCVPVFGTPHVYLNG